MDNSPSSLTSPLNEFQNRRFGMFVHFGLYSQAAEHEWHMYLHHMSLSKYKQQFLDTFDPDPKGIESWITTAKQLGAQYIVITVKHCDGFCLWDTNVFHGIDPAYHFRNTTFWKKHHCDILDILMTAARKENIKVGFYYAIADWSWTDRPIFRHVPHWIKNPNLISKYRQYIKDQLRDLVQKYPEVFLFWFDCFTMHPDGYNFMDYKGIYDLLHQLKPNILVGCNTATTTIERPPPYKYEFIIYENMADKGELFPVLWPRHDPTQSPAEACLTLNNHWGYNVKDKFFKDPSKIVNLLVNNTIRNGNTLLNLGPMASGFFDSDHLERAQIIGKKLMPFYDFILNSRSKQVFSWGGIVQKFNSSDQYLYFNSKSPFSSEIPFEKKPKDWNWLIGSGKIVFDDSLSQLNIHTQSSEGLIRLLF